MGDFWPNFFFLVIHIKNESLILRRRNDNNGDSDAGENIDGEVNNVNTNGDNSDKDNTDRDNEITWE